MTQPTSEDIAVKPDMAGTFAVYMLKDGRGALVLDVEGHGESRHLVPKLIVDMVLKGKKPSMKTLMGLMKGNQ